MPDSKFQDELREQRLRTTGRLLRKAVDVATLIFCFTVVPVLTIVSSGVSPWGTAALGALFVAYGFRAIYSLLGGLRSKRFKTATVLAAASSLTFAASSLAALVAMIRESFFPNVVFVLVGASMAAFSALLARGGERHAA